MAATPAWPPRSTPRLFVEQPLEPAMRVALQGPSAHYLLNVLRIAEGAPVKLFDNISGEYLARVEQRSKRDLLLTIENRTRPRETVPDFWLCAAPIKRQRFDWVAEKACELGVARFVPVQTARAVVDKVKTDRLMSHMIEAAEQCERSALPELGELVPLDRLLAEWPAGRHMFFANERLHEQAGTGEGSFARALSDHPGPAAVLVGPEGGFTDEELDAIAAHPASVPVSLGPRILRADTAALAAISLWMAGRGDWP